MGREQGTTAGLGDVVKHVTVPVPAAEAFRILIEEVADWMPPGHTFTKGPELVKIEEGVGGRFFERGADGVEPVHGVITEWEPPHRVKLTWRMGANWQPVLDDESASFIEFAFIAEGPSTTRVVLTHSEFHRHGPAATSIWAAVNGPSPGESLARYAEVVAKHSGAA